MKETTVFLFLLAFCTCICMSFIINYTIDRICEAYLRSIQLLTNWSNQYLISCCLLMFNWTDEWKRKSLVNSSDFEFWNILTMCHFEIKNTSLHILYTLTKFQLDFQYFLWNVSFFFFSCGFCCDEIHAHKNYIE